MPRKADYDHYCVVARSLELVGDRWTLLIVRDLLREPLRFSDLMRYVNNITPKWLTQRLRDLEATGIVERDSEPGRRDVWYRLTQKGRDLAPVIKSLSLWGIEHATRPPLPGEQVHPEQVMYAITTFMTDRGNFPQVPSARWRFNFDGNPLLIVFDGRQWKLGDNNAAAADLEIDVSARDWAAFLSGTREQREKLRSSITVTGDPAHESEFRRLFRIPSAAPPSKARALPSSA